MRPAPWQALARSAAVLALGALALHQLSYLLAHGDGAGRALAAHGHGYLSTLAPILVTAALALVAASLARAALRPRSPESSRRACPEVRAATLALALLVVFGVQEALALGGLERAELLIASAAWSLERPTAPRSARPTGSRGERGEPLVRLGLGFGLARRGPPLHAHR
jgi:hypothetical protein